MGTRLGFAVAGTALALVAGLGVYGALRPSYDGLPAAPADEPALAWTVGDPVDTDRVVAAGELLLLVGDGTAAVESDGTVRWRDGDRALGTSGDAVVVEDDGRLRGLDLDDGDERWRIGIDDYVWTTMAEDGVYVADGDGITAYDPGSGRERWRITAEVGFDGDEPIIEAVAGMVVAESADYVTRAYDADTGEELWALDDDGSVTAWSDALVLTGDVARDRSGAVGEVRDEPEGTVDVLGTYAVSADGGVYVGLERVATLDTTEGRLALSADGVYRIGGGTLALHPYDDAPPTWEIRVDGAAEFMDVGAGPGYAVAFGDGEVRAYR